MFIEVGENDKTHINVYEIAFISSIFGNSNFLKYIVSLKNGKEITFYENMKNERNYYPRKKLIKKINKCVYVEGEENE